jgi:hypothetical protein
MKNLKLSIVAIAIASLLNSNCTKELIRFEGEGSITTEKLQIDDFTSIHIEGVDDVIITYGTEQEVTVTGHPNIIGRIKTNVSNKTWNIELEEGNYGNYELTYYLTLPLIENITSSGTGDVVVTDFISQENLSIKFIGTGNFHGFPMTVKNCNVDISGTGDCEVSVETRLDATIIGNGNVYYKGNPSINTNISGSGSVIQMND